MCHRKTLGIFSLMVVGLLGLYLGLGFMGTVEARRVKQAQQEEVQSVIDARLAKSSTEEDQVLFDEDGRVSILLIGLDARAGSDVAHCDVIQFVEVDTKEASVSITAVPRGTYSPLPGTGHIPSDYYVSNACGIGGLQYGVDQIERILEKQADYVVFVGFSEAVGLFRLLNLPATETLQWLRMRQEYAVGEPQRAHNHSTFLKQLLTHQTLTDTSRLQTTWAYVLYRLVDTDLLFAQVQELMNEVDRMELSEHPERIVLSMKPAYPVQDIPYDPTRLEAFLETPFNPKDGPSKEQIQQQVMDVVNAGLSDPVFVKRAVEQQLWLQLDDAATRESVHFALLSAALEHWDEKEREAMLADYVIEMEFLGEEVWAEEGRRLLRDLFTKTR